MECVLKFPVDYIVRSSKLNISSKCVLKYAGEYKVRYVKDSRNFTVMVSIWIVLSKTKLVFERAS